MQVADLHTLTHAQAVNIANYKFQEIHHSISFDSSCIIEEPNGCRLRVLAYIYIDFPLENGMDRGVVSSCFHVEFGFSENSDEIEVYFDKDGFYVFGKNFKIVLESNQSMIDGVEMDLVFKNNPCYKNRFTPKQSDVIGFKHQLHEYFKDKKINPTLIREWFKSR